MVFVQKSALPLAISRPVDGKSIVTRSKNGWVWTTTLTIK